MTRDKIQQLAKEAGIDLEHHVSLSREPVWIATPDELAAFAALVLEEAAKTCDVMARGWEDNPGQNPLAGYIAASNCAASVRTMKPEVKT